MIGGLELFRTVLKERFEVGAPTMSLEGFVDTLKDILDRIIAWTKRLFQTFHDNQSGVTLILMELQERHEDMIIRSRQHVRNMNQNGTFTISTRINSYVVRGKIIKDAMSLQTMLARTRDVLQSYYGMMDRTLPGCAQTLVGLVNEDAGVEAVAQAISPFSPLNLYGKRGFISENNVLISNPMLGNVTLRLFSDLSGSAFDNIRSVKLELVPTRLDTPPLPESIEWSRFSLSTFDAIMQLVKEIGAILESTTGSLFLSTRTRGLNDLRGAIEHVRKRLDDPNVDKEEDYRQIVSLIETVISWMTSPYLELYSHSLRTMKAVMNVCEANIS